jgi:hypothetical protein
MKQKISEKVPVKSSLRTLVLFCVVVGAVLILSVCYRIFLLVKNSKFDGASGFIVAMVQDDRKKANLFVFDPAGERVATVHVIDQEAHTHLQQVLAVPVDAVITRKNVSDQAVFPLAFASYRLYDPKEHTDLSILDAVRLWWLFRSIPERDRTEGIVTLPEQAEDLDAALGSLFLDTKLEDEKRTIAIVNGTGISGLGSRLERLLSRIGGSVISITTAHQTVPHSRILYYGERSYTVERLSRILSYPVVEESGSNVSDIVIEIGNDEQRTTKY